MGQSPQIRILVVARQDSHEPITGTLRRVGLGVRWVDNLPAAARAMERLPLEVVIVYVPHVGHPDLEKLESIADERGLHLLTIDGRPGDDQEEARRALATRIEAVLASCAPETTAAASLTVGDLSLDLRRHDAFVGPRPLDLTPREFDLLCHLARHPGWVWSRQQLLESVWGYEVGDLRVVTVHVGNVRKKLARYHPEHTYIETVRGVGYRLGEPGSHGVARHEAGSERLDGHTSPVPAQTPSDHAPFVGREAEIAALRRALAVVATGQVRVVGVSGEAGIGKTRLLEEFSNLATQAGETGFEVWCAACHQGRMRTAYEPWLDVLEAWERWTGHRYVHHVFGRDQPESVRSSREGRQDRLQLMHRLGEAVRARAAENATCIIIEDLQWADMCTLEALQYLVRHLRCVPLLLAVTYRPFDELIRRGLGPALADVVAEIARSDEGFILSLPALSREEVARSVALAGLGLSTAAIAVLGDDAFRQSEGNPFFLTQFLRLMRLRFEGDGERVPPLGREEGVRNVVLQRLHGLTGPCRRWLEGGSVCGRSFEAKCAAKVAGLDYDDLSGLVSEATGARLILLHEADQEECWFTHSLIREVLREELAPDARAVMHDRAAMIAPPTLPDSSPSIASILPFPTENEANGASSGPLSHGRSRGE